LFANAVQRIIDEHLPDFKEETDSYNTDIADSARIASKTILSISQDRPADVHPIAWLNTKYAEDPNWGVGVTAIFEKMKRENEEEM
jgi:putative ABC transport system permease protein